MEGPIQPQEGAPSYAPPPPGSTTRGRTRTTVWSPTDRAHTRTVSRTINRTVKMCTGHATTNSRTVVCPGTAGEWSRHPRRKAKKCHYRVPAECTIDAAQIPIHGGRLPKRARTNHAATTVVPEGRLGGEGLARSHKIQERHNPVQPLRWTTHDP